MLNSFSLPLRLSFASLQPSAFALNSAALSADCSLTSAATAPLRRRGGHTRASHGTQRHQPSQPPCKSVNSVALAELPACHFSGCIAQFAILLHSLHFFCSLHRLRGRAGVGVLDRVLSSLGVMLFHIDSVVSPVLA